MIDREKLICAAGNGAVLFDAPLSSNTSFRIGGCADALVKAEDAEGIRRVLAFAREENIPVFFLGKGSNILVNDKGFRGIILTAGPGLSRITVEKDDQGVPTGVLRAGCGASLAQIAHAALENNLAGLEFASGIPGSLGGAVYMNAGAYGGEMAQVLTTITYLDADGVHTIPASSADLSYRHSLFMQGGMQILEAEMKLLPGNHEEILSRMQDLAAKRREKQPLEYPSAGSMFKRPVGYFAGKLVQDAGLAGFTVGGAQVSAKHCGFVINVGGAQAADVAELVRRVHEIVLEKFGVEIWPEVRYLTETGLAPEDTLWN